MISKDLLHPGSRLLPHLGATLFGSPPNSTLVQSLCGGGKSSPLIGWGKLYKNRGSASSTSLYLHLQSLHRTSLLYFIILIVEISEYSIWASFSPDLCNITFQLISRISTVSLCVLLHIRVVVPYNGLKSHST
jgi:hypothetical protein